MSKTVSTCILETNSVLNQPQENVFFHTIYRTQQDYPNEFLRTARSTSPVQICAIFSCIGPDNFGALLNIQLNEELAKIVASCQNQPVLDFQAFSNQVVNTLNIKVCNFNVSRGGVSMKVSMTMAVIEGDTLRIIHLGNTKAVLIRDNKIMALTEEHTVAHNYVKANAITPEQERTHPDNMNLTQYLGKLPQDGMLNPDRNVRVKLKENDEICLMGLGISRLMPAQMRNVSFVKPLPTENKAREIINSAINYGVKSGLSICLIQIESTFLLPGDAAITSNLATEAPIAKVNNSAPSEQAYTPLNEPYGEVDNSYMSKSNDADESTQKFAFNDETQKFSRGNMDNKKNSKSRDDDKEDQPIQKKPNKFWDFMIPIITLVVCIGIGYGVMYLVFNAKHLIDKIVPETTLDVSEVGTVRYAINDNTPVYYDTTAASSMAILARGEAVTTFEIEGNFYRVEYNGNTGYVYVDQLSDQDPTIGDGIPEITDATPTPTEETTTEATTESTTEATTTTTEATTTTTTATTTSETQPTDPQPTEPQPTDPQPTDPTEPQPGGEEG